MKRIAFVSDAIFPYNKGGKETRLYEISTRLAQKGYDVHIYCMHWWKTSEKIRIENEVTLHAISPFYPLYSGERRSIRQGIMFGLHCLKMLWEDFDIVDVDHMPFFPLYSVKLVCILKRKKMYATWHEVWGKDYWIQYMGKIGIIASMIEHFSIKLPYKINSISPFTTNLLQLHIPLKKIVTIPLGINTELIKNTIPSKNKSNIVYAGRLLKHKNVDVLIQSVKILSKSNSQIKCIIVGDGPEKNSLIQLSRDLSLEKNIYFLQFFNDRKDIYALLKSTNVLVLPSIREGFGLIVIEALACGIPVITTNSELNAAKSIINDGVTGYVTDLNSEEIANKIQKCIYKKGNNIFIKNTVKISKSFDWNLIVKKLERLYN